MINATELRIGNLLNLMNPKVAPFFPVKIDLPRLVALLTGEETTYHAIPLTHGILLKAGFNNKKQAEEFRKEECVIVICVDCWPYIEEVTGAELKYVHELQNLFTAIYKTELPITL